MAATIEDVASKRRNALRVLTAIVAVNGLIYVALRLSAIISAEAAEQFIAALSLPSEAMRAAERPWSLFTYMFTQYDALHAILNMLWFTWFGLILTDAGAGGRFIATTYVGGGIMAASGYLLFGHGPGAFLIGSSGAVMAIVAAAAVASPSVRLDLPLLRSVTVATAAAVIAAIYTAGILFGVGGSHVAHIAGAAAGIIAGLIFRRSTSTSSRADGNSLSPRLSDRVLDKLRSSGYEALTPDERDLLIDVSRPASQSRK